MLSDLHLLRLLASPVNNRLYTETGFKRPVKADSLCKLLPDKIKGLSRLNGVYISTDNEHKGMYNKIAYPNNFLFFILTC